MNRPLCLSRLLSKSSVLTCLLAGLAASFIISGCGGSSGDDIEIKGTLVSSVARSDRAAPLADVQVAVSGTTDTALTDENGEFTIFTDNPGSSLKLLIGIPGGVASYAVENIPEGTDRIVIVLEYDTDTGSLTALSVEFQDDDQNQGEATPTPAATPAEATPTPVPGQPTATPGAATPTPSAATPTPSGKPTATATPGGKPTVAPTTKPTPKPTSGGANAANGKKVYDAKCRACHPNQSRFKGMTAAQLKNIPGMPSLTTQESIDMAAYING